MHFFIAVFLVWITAVTASPSASPSAQPFVRCTVNMQTASDPCSSFLQDAFQGLCDGNSTAYDSHIKEYWYCVSPSPSASPSPTPNPSLYFIPDLGLPCRNRTYMENACTGPDQALTDYWFQTPIANFSIAKHTELINLYAHCIATAQTACVLAYPHPVPPGPPSRFVEIVILIIVASLLVLCVIGCCLYSMCIPERRSSQEPVVVIKRDAPIEVVEHSSS
jgi:hypothetical protein